MTIRFKRTGLVVAMFALTVFLVACGNGRQAVATPPMRATLSTTSVPAGNNIAVNAIQYEEIELIGSQTPNISPPEGSRFEREWFVGTERQEQMADRFLYTPTVASTIIVTMRVKIVGGANSKDSGWSVAKANIVVSPSEQDQLSVPTNPKINGENGQTLSVNVYEEIGLVATQAPQDLPQGQQFDRQWLMNDSVVSTSDSYSFSSSNDGVFVVIMRVRVVADEYLPSTWATATVTIVVGNLPSANTVTNPRVNGSINFRATTIVGSALTLNATQTPLNAPVGQEFEVQWFLPSANEDGEPSAKGKTYVYTPTSASANVRIRMRVRLKGIENNQYIPSEWVGAEANIEVNARPKMPTPTNPRVNGQSSPKYNMDMGDTLELVASATKSDLEEHEKQSLQYQWVIDGVESNVYDESGKVWSYEAKRVGEILIVMRVRAILVGYYVSDWAEVEVAITVVVGDN